MANTSLLQFYSGFSILSQSNININNIVSIYA
jgi:hypothetical protein